MAHLSTLDFGNVRPEKVAEVLERLDRLGVKEEDLEERFIRASGRGGQKLHKTSSAVFLKHRPSGVAVKVQRERSRAVNRFLARRLLADRLERRQRTPIAQEPDREPETEP